ncbi:hypothetical protein ACFQ1M_14780 [Sungkyunkwania multivorans]|uniref:HTTM-like domain-containing protein n=1 Tax=Sungkyunkwania multivorans TaxID=1173618 RepID=A0ABW3D3V3_9FLAO
MKLLNLESENKFAIYLSIFRVFIAFHLLKKIFLQWDYLPILYSNKSFIAHSDTTNFFSFVFENDWLRDNYTIFLGLYVFIVIIYAFGIGKNVVALALYLLYKINTDLNGYAANGGDNLLEFIMLYMIFADSFKYLTINKVSKVKNPSLEKIKNVFSNLAGYSIIIHLCIAYFVSGINKAHADVWFNGVATYYTFSLESYQGTSFNKSLALNGYFVTISTYATILIELYFPVLVWFRKLRNIMLVLMGGIHVGIYIFMAIYDFEILFLSTYGFFFSNDEWKSFLRRILSKVKPALDKLRIPYPQALILE